MFTAATPSGNSRTPNQDQSTPSWEGKAQSSIHRGHMKGMHIMHSWPMWEDLAWAENQPKFDIDAVESVAKNGQQRSIQAQISQISQHCNVDQLRKHPCCSLCQLALLVESSAASHTSNTDKQLHVTKMRKRMLVVRSCDCGEASLID